LTAKVLYPVYVISPIVDVAVFPEPDASVIVTVGADVYPLPGLVTIIELISAPESSAFAVAPKPPPPDIVTVGAP
jgi:hypothetical protein